ncbi:hypothetical protein GX48_01454 [Paracoccidioides brasiliensis]|nr:hypothetical protein GX48_01454 [Paracoccidioides brasiliensis]
MASRAIPSHLRAPGSGTGPSADGSAERKHHGKSQSHMDLGWTGLGCEEMVPYPATLKNCRESVSEKFLEL